MRFKLQCSRIKFYWNIPVLMHLCIICGYFPATVTELSSCDGDCVACEAKCISHLAGYGENEKQKPKRETRWMG